MTPRGARASRRWLALAATALLGSACVTFKPLPVDMAAGKGWQPFKPKYEKTTLFVLKSTGEMEVERAFVNPKDPANIVLSIVAPTRGVLASTDGGASWSFSEIKVRDTDYQVFQNGSITTRATHWFVFRDLLFDVADPHRIYATAGAEFWRSDDAGLTWHSYVFARGNFLGNKQTTIDFLAEGSDGTLFAPSGDRIYASRDGGETWAEETVDAYAASTSQKVLKGLSLGGASSYRVQSVAVDPGRPNVVYASIRSEGDIGGAFHDMSSAIHHAAHGEKTPEQLAAEALLASTDPTPREYGWRERDGVFVSTDGGASWRRAGLRAHSLLVGDPVDHAVYAVIDDGHMQGLFAAANQANALYQAAIVAMQGGAPDEQAVRALLAYPDLPHLLFGDLLDTVVLRSVDDGATWAKVVRPAPALLARLRDSVERQRNAVAASIEEAAARNKTLNGRDPSLGGATIQNRYQMQQLGGGRSAGMMGLFLGSDGTRILGNYNWGVPLVGMSSAGDGRTFYAFVPSRAYWDAMVASIVGALEELAAKAPGKSHGFHVSWGGHDRDIKGYPYPRLDLIHDNGTFELLRSDDGGASWQTLSDAAEVLRALDGDGSLLSGRDHVVLYPSVVQASAGPAFVLVSGTKAEKGKQPSLRASYRYLPGAP